MHTHVYQYRSICYTCLTRIACNKHIDLQASIVHVHLSSTPSWLLYNNSGLIESTSSLLRICEYCLLPGCKAVVTSYGHERS